MDFAQLRDADIGTLEALVSPWNKAAEKLETGAESATSDVGDRIRSGEWEGEAADTATERISFLETQTAAGHTEASAIHSILEEAVLGLSGCQDRLNGIISVVGKIPELEINGDGRVSITKEQMMEYIARRQLAPLATHIGLAAGFNLQIRDCLQDARQIDGDLADALRAAAKADQPENLDFNPDADGSIDVPNDGSVGKGPSLKPEFIGYWTEIGARSLTEPFASGTPEEQSAGLGEMVKTDIERAGGECKTIDGLMVCVGAPDNTYMRGGTTIGDTFVSSDDSWEEWERRSKEDRSELIAHETYHRDEQWRQEGLSFGRKYLVEELYATAGGYLNRYEYEAETEGGETGYLETDPPQNPPPELPPDPSPDPPEIPDSPVAPAPGNR